MTSMHTHAYAHTPPTPTLSCCTDATVGGFTKPRCAGSAGRGGRDRGPVRADGAPRRRADRGQRPVGPRKPCMEPQQRGSHREVSKAYATSACVHAHAARTDAHTTTHSYIHTTHVRSS
jgi:hypothetical protein